jgi:hypothetical protein
MHVLLLAKLVNRQNIRMIQARGGKGFLLKTAQAFFVFGNTFRQNFERDFTPQFCIFGKINLAHPARAERI